VISRHRDLCEAIERTKTASVTCISLNGYRQCVRNIVPTLGKDSFPWGRRCPKLTELSIVSVESGAKAERPGGNPDEVVAIHLNLTEKGTRQHAMPTIGGPS
jgi:hypothetical protein